MYDVIKSLTAHSVEEALQMAQQEENPTFVCGGTDVMIRLKERKLKSAALISLLEIPELFGVTMTETGDLRIAPGTTMDELYRDPLINRYIPILAEAANQVGSPQIRHIASVGGNLCNGAVSADTVPSLLALDAQLELTSLQGVRSVHVCEFHTGPGRTVLQQGEELLTAILIPKESYEGWGGKYLKFGMRNAMEISTLGCAVTARLTPDGERIDRMRLAFGVAGPRPLRCPILEQELQGMQVNEELFEKIGKEAHRELQPRNSWRASKQLRLQLIRTLSERAAREAVQRAGGADRVL